MINPYESKHIAIHNANINPLKVQLNPICHLLALLGPHYIFHVSGLRVNIEFVCSFYIYFYSMLKQKLYF